MSRGGPGPAGAAGAVRIRPAGDRALLIEAGEDRRALVERLRRDLPDGVVDVLPAAATVLVTVAAGTDLDALSATLTQIATGAGRGAAVPGVTSEAPLQVPVVYDGDDLADVADQLGTSVEEVIARHTGEPWTCDFIGFAPGFGYLTRPASTLTVARRATSRTSVPAGSVALAGSFSAVYPRSTPGGWQLIGRTDAPLWDADRPEPALIRAGTVVRFAAVSAR